MTIDGPKKSNVAKRNVLLLQGPLGPFFEHLADALDQAGMVSHRIAFNMGDRCFARGQYIDSFLGPAEEWEGYLKAYVSTHKIDCVILYGDSRFYHRIAREVCEKANCPVLCLEEGYIRPGYITAEWGGNNANSPLLTPAIQTESLSSTPKVHETVETADSFSKRAWWATVYYNMHFYLGWLWGFKGYQHHRPGFAGSEMMCWLRSGVRKFLYKIPDRKILSKIKGATGRRFFVPLQVSVDAQIIHHSDFDDIEDFIEVVMHDFVESRRPDDILIFKHHPMDRGFKNYTGLISQLTKKYNLNQHVFYCFDLDVCVLLSLTTACITVNSTVGYSALQQNIPVFTYGPAFFDALTFQKSISDFIKEPLLEKTLEEIEKFTSCIKDKALISGDFYNRTQTTSSHIVSLIDSRLSRLKF